MTQPETPMTNKELAEEACRGDGPFSKDAVYVLVLRALDKAQMRPTEGETRMSLVDMLAAAIDRVEEVEADRAKIKRELATCEARAYERSKTSPVARLHNICDALQYDKENSPYSAESWDELVAENDSLRKQLAALSPAPVPHSLEDCTHPISCEQVHTAPVERVGEHNGGPYDTRTSAPVDTESELLDARSKLALAAENEAGLTELLNTAVMHLRRSTSPAYDTKIESRKAAQWLFENFPLAAEAPVDTVPREPTDKGRT